MNVPEDRLIALESYRDELIERRNKILDTWRYLLPWYRKKLVYIDYKLDFAEKVIRELNENLQN